MAKPYSYPICVGCGRRHPTEQCLRGTERCYQCGKEGHYIRDCPYNQPYVPIGGSFYRPGGFQNEAPRMTEPLRHTIKPDPYLICVRCWVKHPGHYFSDCPDKKSHVIFGESDDDQEKFGNETSGRILKKIDQYPLCNNCGFRHKAVLCLRGTNRCFRCGEVGHIMKDCPKKESADA